MMKLIRTLAVATTLAVLPVGAGVALASSNTIPFKEAPAKTTRVLHHATGPTVTGRSAAHAKAKRVHKHHKRGAVTAQHATGPASGETKVN